MEGDTTMAYACTGTGVSDLNNTCTGLQTSHPNTFGDREVHLVPAHLRTTIFFRVVPERCQYFWALGRQNPVVDHWSRLINQPQLP